MQHEIAPRKNTGIAIILIVLTGIFALIILGIPALLGFILSFQNYNPMMGLANSDFVGLDNFIRIVDSFIFPSLIINTIRLSFVGEILPVIIGTALALLIFKQNSTTRPLFLGLVLLPVFIPSTVYASIASNIFMTPNSFLGEAAFGVIGVDLGFFFVSGVPKLFLSAFFALALATVCDKTPIGGKKGAMIAGLALLFLSISGILSPNIEAVTLLQNHLNLEVSETLDSYEYKTGFAYAEFGMGAAVTVIKNAFQLIMTIIAGIVICSLINTIILSGEIGEETEISEPRVPSSGVGFVAIISAVVAVIVSVAMIIISVQHPGLGGFADTFIVLFNTVTVALFTTVLFITFTGLCGFSLGNLSPTFALAYCGIISLISANYMGNYLISRSIGTINTFIPIIFQQIIRPELILCVALLTYFGTKIVGPKNNFSVLLPYLALFAGLSLSNVWGSFYEAMIYTMDHSTYTLGLLLRNASFEGFSVTTTAIYVIVPIIIGVFSAIIFDNLSKKRVQGV